MKVRPISVGRCVERIAHSRPLRVDIMAMDHGALCHAEALLRNPTRPDNRILIVSASFGCPCRVAPDHQSIKGVASFWIGLWRIRDPFLRQRHLRGRSIQGIDAVYDRSSMRRCPGDRRMSIPGEICKPFQPSRSRWYNGHLITAICRRPVSERPSSSAMAMSPWM